MERILEIGTGGLDYKNIANFVRNPETSLTLDPGLLQRVRQGSEIVKSQTDKQVIYGVNTGFGPMADRVLSSEDAVELQYNLIRSHAVSMGSELPSELVLSAMLVRLNTLLKGYSGVSEGLIEALLALINNRITPVILEHGSVGASGDLVQLSHIALALIGEGQVYYQNKKMQATEALSACGLKPYELLAKEGLSLINGTSFMAGVAALISNRAVATFDLALKLSAWSLELIGAHEDMLDSLLHSLRPHAGQIAVAEELKKLLSQSNRLKRRYKDAGAPELNHYHQKLNRAIQEVYSFRCIPQILGPVKEALEKFGQVVNIEVNSVTDNPIVDLENKIFLHGGNFHGDYIAASTDELKAHLARLAQISERRTNFFMNEKINSGLFPPFANLGTPGLSLGLQGLQFVATSTMAHAQSLAFPHRLHSIPTNGDNQDVVSMGGDSSLMCLKVLEDAQIILSIEALTLAQNTDALQISNLLTDSAQDIYKKVREICPTIVSDRDLSEQLVKLTKGLN